MSPYKCMSHSSLLILDIFTFLKDYLLIQMKLKLKSTQMKRSNSTTTEKGDFAQPSWLSP